MIVVHTAADLRAVLGHAPGRCVFVPTMGALHAGHAALVARGGALARERGLGSVVVSVFVNQTQFNDPNDFARYPRTLDADAVLCARAGAGVLFAPSPAHVYPFRTPVRVPQLPLVAATPCLEDFHRPDHFAGVCQVVRRLFALVEPACALFGEKDWQQLATIRAMTHEECLPIEIIGVPTVREKDGLAMSSRNRFLSRSERKRALAISAALREANNHASAIDAEAAMVHDLVNAGIKLEYAVVRDSETMDEVGVGPARALIAAKVGATRLIDNAPWRSDERKKSPRERTK